MATSQDEITAGDWKCRTWKWRTIEVARGEKCKTWKWRSWFMKLQNMKMQISRVKKAGYKNAGLKTAGRENRMAWNSYLLALKLSGASAHVVIWCSTLCWFCTLGPNVFLMYSLPGYNKLNARYRAYQPKNCFDRRYSYFILQLAIVPSLFPTHWRHALTLSSSVM